MGIHTVLGRDFTMRDMETRKQVALINETLAKKFFPGINPLGHHLSLGSPFDAAHSSEIVGVAEDAKFAGLRLPVPANAYLSYAAGDDSGMARVTFGVRTAGDPQAMLPAIRRAVLSLDAQLPLIQVQTQQQLVEDSLHSEQVFARLSTAFALIALTLAVIGLYGNLSYAVSRRTSEIGIRVAVGAVPRDVIRLILQTSLLLVLAGAALGCFLAWSCTRLLAGILYGVRPMDAAIVAAAILILILVSVLAAFLPAWRAAHIDPLVALRYE